jgi:DNA repair exonuclease SbcCD nuclease subunit
VFKFLHAADIHLDSPLLRLDAYEGAPAADIRGATRRAFENLVQTALDEKVDFVLLAGDVYDGDWKDYNTGLHFASRLARLREAGIPVLLAAGNHDAASSISRSLRLPESVRVFPHDRPETVVLEPVNVAVHGQGFSTPAVRVDLSRGYPPPVPGRFNVGLLHTAVNGREGHEPYAPCTLAALREKGYDYWALGHVHQREVLSEAPLVVFPGNTQGRHARETGPKGCVLVTVDDAGRAAIDFRPLDVVRWESLAIDAEAAGSAYDVVDGFRERIPGLLSAFPDGLTVVRVRVDGATAAHDELRADPERWESELRAAAVEDGAGRLWVERIRLETRGRQASDDATPDGAMGDLLSLIDEIEDDPAALGALAAELTELEKKLPRELREGAEGWAPDRPGWLAGILAESRSMLLRRLTAEREDA